MLEREIAALAYSLADIRNMNDHYVIVARLDAQEQRDAEEYVQQVADLNTATRAAIQAYLETIPTPRRASWNISDNVINQPLRPNGWSITQSRSEIQQINQRQGQREREDLLSKIEHEKKIIE